MLITVKGVIYEITNQRSGTGKNGNPWNSFDVIVETYRKGEYVDLVMINVFNQNEANFKVGSKVSIDAYLTCSKYKDKYYTNIKVKDFVVDNGAGKAFDQNKEERENAAYQKGADKDRHDANQAANEEEARQYKKANEQYESSNGTNNLPF